MAPDQHKSTLRRYVEEVVNQNRLSVIDKIFDATYVNHTPLGDMHGPEGMKTFIARVRAMLPDVQAVIEDVIADEDKAAMRLTLHGTYHGEILGVAYQGRRVTLPEIQLYRFGHGRIVERWYIADRLGMWQQLGALPR